MIEYVIALLVIIAYFVVVYVLNKKGILAKHHLTQGMIFLMWRTEGGKKVIEKLSKFRKFWLVYAAVAKWICLGVAIFMMSLLIWEATLVSSIPADKAPGPEMILGIPGINPIIPIWYGIIGLIVAVVFHEFAHGILTRVGKMDIKSLGIVFLVIPLGAFVEPDEEAIVKADRKRRTSIYAVGPGTNIILAVVCAILFSSVMLSSVTPVREGPVVVTVADNSISSMNSLQFGAQVVSVNGGTVSDIYSWQNATAPNAGATVSLSYYYKGGQYNVSMPSGVQVTGVTKGYPAYNVGIQSGMLIASLNNTPITNENDLRVALHNTHGGQTVNITVMSYHADTEAYENVSSINNVTLLSRADYLRSSGATVPSSFVDYGFMGINSAYLGAGVVNVEVLSQRLSSPYANMQAPGDFITDTLRYISLPFIGLAPVQSPVTELFHPTGLVAPFGADAFWVTANILYWVFWINLMVGMTNVLPAVPLDGGFLFKDGLGAFVDKIKKNATEEQRAKYVALITYALALFVLFLIVWQLIGPRLNG
ncbi:MAG: site-2 protease family protein [Methanomassiliicoccales archaeon]|jgi:membrane-associated protease RseP (regulator of RpoE activity)